MTEQRLTDRAAFEKWAEPLLGDNPTWRESGPCELAWQAWRAAILSADRGEPVARVIVYEKDFPHVDVVDWGDKKPPPGEYKLYAAAPSTPQPAPERHKQPHELPPSLALRAYNALSEVDYEYDPPQRITDLMYELQLVAQGRATPQPDTVQVPKHYDGRHCMHATYGWCQRQDCRDGCKLE